MKTFKEILEEKIDEEIMESAKSDIMEMIKKNKKMYEMMMKAKKDDDLIPEFMKEYGDKLEEMGKKYKMSMEEVMKKMMELK